MQLRKASSWFRQPLVGFASPALGLPAPRRLLQLHAGPASPASALPPPRWFRHLHVGSASPALGAPAPRWFRQPHAGFATSTLVPPALKSDAVRAIEENIATYAASVATFNKELQETKAALEPWDEKYAAEALVGQISPAANSMVTRLSAKVAAAQAALKEEKDRLENANAKLVDQLNKEKDRELEREKLAAESAPPLPFEEAFKRLDLSLPADLTKFEPQPVQLPDFHPYKASMLSAKVMGKFTDPTKPDFLLTEMFKPTDECFDRLRISDDNFVQGRMLRPNDMHVLVLIGTSGAGKTLYSYRLANENPTLLFVCNRLGNGGSDDMGAIINEAVAKEKQGHEVVTAFVNHNLLKAVAFRTRIYKECIKQYGAEFRPHHWAMAQLYPTQIFGTDIFLRFQKMAVNDDDGILAQTTSLPLFHRIVIDEAQVVDDKLSKIFPSESKGREGELCRSLLSPFVKALACLDPKLLICGTGLSAVSVYETTVSSLKPGVGGALIGSSKYFTEDRVLQVLESWGIPRMHAEKWAPTFAGRPRHADFLANALVKDPTKQEENVKLEIVDSLGRYDTLIQAMRRIDTENPQKNSNSAGDFTLLYEVRRAALSWILGQQGFLKANTLLAVRYGVASLMRIDHELHCVVREPLLLEALLTKDPTFRFEFFLGTSDSGVGYQFENYLGLKMPQLVGDISELLNQSGAVDEKFKRQWKFPSLDYTRQLVVHAKDGEESTWLTRALTLSTPPTTVCFPGTAMGPDLIVCAHEEGKPENRLVVLIQTKSGKASTPNAFCVLEHLYCQNRDLAPVNELRTDGEANKVQTVEEPTTGKKATRKYQVPKRLKESKKVVEELLRNRPVVRLVIKPQAGSECDSIEGLGNFVNFVLDQRNSSKFPCLESGLEKLAGFKNAPKYVFTEGTLEDK